MKKDNKGFSLVELIIVIAIMAVLVGLLAPQYLKYVNNSKVSTDVSNGQEVATVFNVGFADSVVTTANSPISAIDAAWVVTLGDNGVESVTLNGMEVWPDPKQTGGYYEVNHK